MILSKIGIRISIFVFIAVLLSPNSGNAQETDTPLPSPRGAFLRSLVMPGWGHYYVDNTNWKRGQYHLAADVAMILGYTGISIRNNRLEDNLITFARSNANINLNGRSREIYLAIAEFDNLDAYNDYQLISRNWNDLLPESTENQWNWHNDDDRFEYQDMRQRIDDNENQLPALVTLMVMNRLVSGISAFVQARNKAEMMPEASFSYLNDFGEPGLTAHLRFNF